MDFSVVAKVDPGVMLATGAPLTLFETRREIRYTGEALTVANNATVVVTVNYLSLIHI